MKNWNGPLITTAFIVIWIFVAIGYDFFAGYMWGSPATISDRIAIYAKQWPIIALAMGALMGHFFWNLMLGGG